MAVISYREVIPRTASHKFGESPTAERKYIVTVDEPTPTQTLINAVGIFHAGETVQLRQLHDPLSAQDHAAFAVAQAKRRVGEPPRPR